MSLSNYPDGWDAAKIDKALGYDESESHIETERDYILTEDDEVGFLEWCEACSESDELGDINLAMIENADPEKFVEGVAKNSYSLLHEALALHESAFCPDFVQTILDVCTAYAEKLAADRWADGDMRTYRSPQDIAEERAEYFADLKKEMGE